jgi:hypothetical protein
VERGSGDNRGPHQELRPQKHVEIIARAGQRSNLI